jgi:antitoxin Phd
VNEWPLKEAKANFSEIVRRAFAGEPQIVTKYGKKAVIVMSYDDYVQLEQKSISLLDVFSTAPRLDEDELPLKRDKTPIKPFRLE